MITYKLLNTYVALLHGRQGFGGYYATGRTRLEAITKVLLNIYIN